jgi:hypothetical protein
MLLRAVRRSCFVAVLLAASFALAQSDFSADIVNLQKPGSAPVRIYLTKDKMRVETAGNSPHGGGAMIMNFATQTSMVIMAQQHMYMEMPAQTQSQRIGYAFFQTGDVENACGDWQKSGHHQDGSCHKVGSDSVNGRSAVKYEATNANGDVSHFWLDPKLRFPVKWDGKNSSGELRNIQEGSQPSTLFEVPSGFSKMQIPAGMSMPPQ